jgi:hypothetical protein
MGVYPPPFLEVMHASVENLVEHLETARLGAAAMVAAGK